MSLPIENQDDTPLYSSRLTKSYVEYIKKNHPAADIDLILKHADISLYQINDGGHWFTQNQINRFHEKAIEETRETNLSRLVGRNFTNSKAANDLVPYVCGLLTPTQVYALLGHLTKLVTKTSNITIHKVNDARLNAIVKLNPGINEKPFQCDARLGIFESLAKLFTGKFAQVSHPECIHKGGNCCKYEISWNNASSIYWKRVSNLTVFAGGALLAGLFPFLPLIHWSVCFGLFGIIIFIVYHLRDLQQRKELVTALTNQGEIARELLDETNQRYNETLLINEIGQAISNILHLADPLQEIMNVLQRRLDFSRGLLLLADKDKTQLLYKANYGYAEEHVKNLCNVAIDLNHPDSRRPSVLTFRTKKPLLMNAVGKLEGALPAESLEWFKTFKTEAFVCMPIIVEKESIGILFLDNPKTGRDIKQSDLSLLSGIAHQIAITINNSIAYQKLQASEERFRSLSDNAPDIICHLTQDGTITYVNTLWEEILGHPKEEVLGHRFREFIPPEKIEFYAGAYAKIWRNKKIVHNIEGEVLSKNEGEKNFSTNIAPNIDPEGRMIGTVVIMKDITEKRKLENQLRQAQKMEAIGTLAGGIAHDFNNILAAIMGYTEIAMSELDQNNQIHHFLDQVLQSSYRAKDLIKQILAFSRQTEQEFKPLKVVPIVKESAKLLRASIPTTIDINVSIKTREDTILGDPTQIHQVMMNLCTNAAQAMKDRGGLLTIELAQIDLLPERAAHDFHIMEQEPHLVLTVRDTGSGMDAMTMTRIFDPFFTTKKPGEGTGMGLSVVHGIVKSHKGAILVDSCPDEGTIFRVYFPLLKEEDDATDAEDGGLSISGNEHILFVDDEIPLARLGREALNRLGYRVTIAMNGMDAFKLFRARPDSFDLVITDLTMPQLTGLELTAELLKIRPDIPVIVCTGFSELLTLEKARKIGIRDVMVKPIVAKKIAVAIRRELDAQKSARSAAAVHRDIAHEDKRS